MVHCYALHLLFFFFTAYLFRQHLPSFPTRRSSDLRDHGRRRGQGRPRHAVERRSDPYRRHSHPAARWKSVPRKSPGRGVHRSEEHTSELQSLRHLVCRLLLEKKKLKEHTTYSPIYL